MGLYRKKGFTIEGTVKMDMCVRGVYYDHHIMGLTIDPPEEL
ncbi:MAG: GNAT family protein [Verrucomicrobiales bacterium]|nr:GNAT family protein [Verrucomicrobiales bacterium]